MNPPTRLYMSMSLDGIELELARRLEGRDVTHLRYRVRHGEERV